MDVPTLDFRVLGTIEVVEGGPSGRVLDIGGGRQRRLLAALLVDSNTTVSLDRLTERMWDDGERPDRPERAVAALRTYVSRLRASLPHGDAIIVTRPPGYVFHLDGHRLDATRFSTLVAEAKTTTASDPERAAAIIDDALALWRGDAYAELADLEWLRAEVARLEELRVSAREERADAQLRVGRHDHVIAELERLVVEHPLRERPRGLLMTALYRAGRQAEALTVMGDYRRYLRDETGLQPSVELRHLESRVLANDPALALPDSGPGGTGGAGPVTPLRSYRLGPQLGTGAFAVVHRAVQPSVGRSVAVKIIRAELANRAEFIRRFEAEAFLVARLEHPHIVPLYDYWREPGRACLVMRWLRGGTLIQSLSERGPLAVGEATTMITQIGAALAAAHRAGVVHRDVKPANVFLDGEGNFYLGDFGIALEAAEANDPEASLSAGSPAYASPEQLRRQPVGPAADVHGLGITAFEALTGRLPFPDEVTQVGLLKRQLSDPIPRVRDFRGDVPAALDDVLQRATAKSPADRYPDVEEFVAAFTMAIAAAQPPQTSVAARGAATVIPNSIPNPYKGLRPFTEADAGDFCGRARLVDELVAHLQVDGVEGRVLAVVGPSGIGKSSVVRAGLLPALRRGAVTGSQDWFVVTMIPGRDPFEELAPALMKIAVDPPSQLPSMLRDDTRGLTRVVKTIIPDGSQLLLVIDQFEELFTLTVDEGVRRRFLDSLIEALNDLRCPLRVVLTLRADFYDRPLRYGDFARLIDGSTVRALPLAADELERAIVDPAARAGVTFEPGLVSRIVADVADQPAALPILQYALTELYEHRLSGLLTLAAYESLGGVTGALAARAEQLYAESSATEQAASRRLFTRLVTLGEGVEDTRRRVPRAELGSDAATATVIDRFGAARLLSFDREPVSREPTVEVAHEALIREWPQLRGWLHEDRDGLRVARRLTEAALSWEAAGRDSGELYRGGRLEAASDWLATHPDDPNPLERDFLATSHRKERSTARRRRVLTAALALLTVLAVLAASLAFGAQRKAHRNAAVASAARDHEAELRRSSDIGRLVAESKAAQDQSLQLSLLLAREANLRENSVRTQGALQSALVSSPSVLGYLVNDGVAYRSVSLSGDGRRLAARPRGRPGRRMGYREPATGDTIATGQRRTPRRGAEHRPG